MVTATSTVFGSLSDANAERSLLSHWRQVDRFSTVEHAEELVDLLRSQGVDAVLSMADALCVLARRD